MSLLKKAWDKSLEPSLVDEASDEAARRFVRWLGRNGSGGPHP